MYRYSELFSHQVVPEFRTGKKVKFWKKTEIFLPPFSLCRGKGDFVAKRGTGCERALIGSCKGALDAP